VTRGPTSTPTRFESGLVEGILADVAAGRPVRKKLPGGGRLHLDRPLPFLCVYRRPPGRDDPGTRRLVAGEAAYLVVPDDRALRSEYLNLLWSVAGDLVERFGAFLVLEVWAASGEALDPRARSESPVPGYRVMTGRGDGLAPTVEALEAALLRIRVLKHPAEVGLCRGAVDAPEGLKPLRPGNALREAGVRVLGLEVQPVYRGPRGEPYPMVLRRVQRLTAVALRRAFHRFAVTRTRAAPVSYLALGRQAVTRATWAVDRQLAEVAGAFDLLLKLTPVNLHAAWRAFKRHGFEKAPTFYYRALPMDPAVVKRRLFSIPVEAVEEPTLAQLFREKQLGLDRQLTMLLDRGSTRLLHGSLQLFGGVSDELLALARSLLERIPPRSRAGEGRQTIDATAFAERAREEIAYYRSRHPEFAARVELRDDMYAGLMVSRGQLLVGSRLRAPASRVTGLLHHEVGTHALTYYNGRAQPMHLLYCGLPGYDELQEGLAVLAEYLCGALSRQRLRLLAGRVLAARLLIGGTGFIDSFRALHREHGFNQQTAFTIAARIHRGGGLVKDAVYLRGLAHVLEYLAGGGALEPLFIGKIAAHHVPIVEELRLRGVLAPPPLTPRWLEDEAAKRRLAGLREGRSVLDLLEGEER